MTPVNNNDQIQDAFNELRCLNVIIEELPNDWLRINISRLYMLGYLLLVRNNKIHFTTISDFNYMYNPNIYLNNIIPKSSLASFTLIQMKNVNFSP